MKKILLILLLIHTLTCGNCQTFKQQSLFDIESIAQKGEWWTAKSEKGITIDYRWLQFSDTLKTRELSVCFYTLLPKESFIKVIQNPSEIKKWDTSIKTIKIYNLDSTSWINHSIYNIPFPFTQQDLLTKNKVVKDEDQIHIIIKTVPNYLPYLENFERQIDYYAYWNLQSTKSGITKVTYSVISMADSNIPRFLKDPIIQKKLLKSFHLLQNRCNTLYALKKSNMNIFKNLLRLEDSSHKIAKSFAVGSFIGMLPIPGFQVIVALLVARIFYLNKKAACVAVFNTNLFSGLFIFAFNFWLGKTVLNISTNFVFPEKLGFDFILIVLRAGSDVFLSLMVGGILTGIAFALLAYPIVKYLFDNRYKKEAE